MTDPLSQIGFGLAEVPLAEPGHGGSRDGYLLSWRKCRMKKKWSDIVRSDPSASVGMTTSQLLPHLNLLPLIFFRW